MADLLPGRIQIDLKGLKWFTGGSSMLAPYKSSFRASDGVKSWQQRSFVLAIVEAQHGGCLKIPNGWGLVR